MGFHASHHDAPGGADLAAVFWGVLDTNRNEYILHRGLAASAASKTELFVLTFSQRLKQKWSQWWGRGNKSPGLFFLLLSGFIGKEGQKAHTGLGESFSVTINPPNGAQGSRCGAIAAPRVRGRGCGWW